MPALAPPRSAPVPPRRKVLKNFRFSVETLEKVDELAALREHTATRVIEEAIAEIYRRDIKKLRAKKAAGKPEEQS